MKAGKEKKDTGQGNCYKEFHNQSFSEAGQKQKTSTACLSDAPSSMDSVKSNSARGSNWKAGITDSYSTDHDQPKDTNQLVAKF